VHSLTEASKPQSGDFIVCEMTVPPGVSLFETVKAVLPIRVAS
jgi:hypothetical protein